MTLPTLVALSRTALRGVAVEDREAAMALGATRWQVVRNVVLPTARPGIGAALTLALGRAMGEAIAVALVIGNRPALPHSLIEPGATLGSAIVNQFAEAQPGLGQLGDCAGGRAPRPDRGSQRRRPDFQESGQGVWHLLRTYRWEAPGGAGLTADVVAGGEAGATPSAAGTAASATAEKSLPRRLVSGAVGEVVCVVA